MGRAVIPLALSLISRTETEQLHAYHGSADAPGVMTVGKGHVVRMPQESWMLKGITKEQSDKLFADDVAKHAAFIQQDAGTKVDLDDYVFGALASLCYNVGKRTLTIAPSIVKPLREGKPRLAMLNLYKFSISDGKYRDGLFYRRLVEATLALRRVLVAMPADCVQAVDLIDQLKAYGDMKPMVDYFRSRHRKELCRVCKRHK